MKYYLPLLCLLGKPSKGSDGPSREPCDIDHNISEIGQNGSDGQTGNLILSYCWIIISDALLKE